MINVTFDLYPSMSARSLIPLGSSRPTMITTDPQLKSVELLTSQSLYSCDVFSCIYKGAFGEQNEPVAISRLMHLTKPQIKTMQQMVNAFHFSGTLNPYCMQIKQVLQLDQEEAYYTCEYATHRSLSEYMSTHAITYRQRLEFAQQIASGLMHLCKQPTVDGISLTSDMCNVYVFQEQDVIRCKIIPSFKKLIQYKYCVWGDRYRFMDIAPECFRHIGPGQCPTDEPSVVYMYGMMIYFLVTGVLPFADFRSEMCHVSPMGDIFDGNLPIIPDTCSDFFKQLLLRTWAFDPLDRPTFAQLVTAISAESNLLI